MLVKKKIMAATLVALVGAGAFISARNAYAEKNLSEIQLANIEAVADCEVTDSEGKVIAYCVGDEAYCSGTLTIIDGIAIYCKGKQP